jgi:hypothetical protein
MSDTLPTSPSANGCVYFIRNNDASAFYIIAASGAPQLDGVTNGSFGLSPGQQAAIQSNGTNYTTVFKPIQVAPPFDPTCVPWVAHAFTMFPADSVNITNPTPQTNGLVGEISSLPYTVPSSKKLVLNYLSIQGNTGAAMFPWVGSGSFVANVVIQTFTAPTVTTSGTLPGTREWKPNFIFPAGVILNLTMEQFGQPANTVYGWTMGGMLCAL